MYKEHKKIACINCGRLIDVSNIKKHEYACINGYKNAKINTYILDHDDLFCKFCKKECKNKNSLIQHELRCKENPNRKDYNKFSKYIAENRKGKTKENCEDIAKQVATMKAKYENGYISPNVGRPGTFTNHKHSEITKQLLSEKARYNAKNHLNGWKSGNNRIPNKYEKFTEEFLINHNIDYLKEVVVPQSELGKKGSYYQLDFLVNNHINLEIDGSSHIEIHDSIRDNFVRKKYIVYRINHHDSIDILNKELVNFLDYLDS